MTALWVMPSIDRAYGDACIATIQSPYVERVDNCTPNPNRGVAVSWNIGIDAMHAGDHDWLIIVSESVRLGPAGGADLEAALAAPLTTVGPCDQTCGAIESDDGAGICRRGFGWHLIALHRDVIEQVGRFDEVFWPAWYEDTDYTRRMHLAGPIGTKRVDGIEAHLVAVQHTIKAGLVHTDWTASRAEYVKKWGGDDGHERFDHPYDNPDADWRDVTRSKDGN